MPIKLTKWIASETKMIFITIKNVKYLFLEKINFYKLMEI
ncbi:hypothetical protein BCAH1134_3449 [Bacillus cereus AH1134]|nr:hypothetical protein BCAH1134_3449 [Bacillus cereus AH1134]QDD84632.1 hypothetical protein FORC087_3341 [Bacillus cereus]